MINERIIREARADFFKAMYYRAVGCVVGTGIFCAADAVASGAVSSEVGSFISGIIIGNAIKNDIISSNTGFLIASSIIGTMIGIENSPYEFSSIMLSFAQGITIIEVGVATLKLITRAVAGVDDNGEVPAEVGIYMPGALIACGAMARTISASILSKLKANYYIEDNIDLFGPTNSGIVVDLHDANNDTVSMFNA